MSFTTTLYKALEAADSTLIATRVGDALSWCEVGNSIFGEPLDTILCELDDETQVEFDPQEIEIGDDGEADATDVEGTKLRLCFSMTRPLRQEDLSR